VFPIRPWKTCSSAGGIPREAGSGADLPFAGRPAAGFLETDRFGAPPLPRDLVVDDPFDATGPPPGQRR